MKKKKGRKEKKPTIQYNRGNKYAVNKKRGLQDCKMGDTAGTGLFTEPENGW
jgi:hypothetical protein